jgi:peptidoglycan/xylan/chitin deacetylase (PgdA/CDA1 family)
VRALSLGAALLLLAGCASTAAAPAPPAGHPTGAPTGTVIGESEDFVVVLAKGGETAEALARAHLGDAAKAWMIEDYMGARAFTAGQRVVIPKRPWNPSGVEPTGYQLVPILVYHNLGPQSKGRLVLGVEAFAEQMRYLGREGYRVVTLAEFVEWLQLRRQLPRKSVVLTFDDGYRSFREHAYPVLKELGFPATLFVYTDYVGASRNALAWEDLRSLVAEGFDVQAHSKTHGDLRRAAGETDAQYARRMQAELADPPKLFQRQLGRGVPFLAYPYGRVDEGLLARVREQGYTAAFTVRRESNASFVRPLQISRSQIYSEMTLEQFARNLDLFHAEDLR